MAPSARQEDIKAQFIRERGGWNDTWERFLELAPDFLAAYLDFAMVSWRKNKLDPKAREFIYIGLHAVVTHLHEPELRLHIREALKIGASAEEIVEVIELASTLDIHAVNVGMPILAEVLTRRGLRSPDTPLTPYQERLKAEFVRKRGYWRAFWDETLELDPKLFEAYTNFSSLPAQSGRISPKVRELICLAFNIATTHLYVPSTRLHFETLLDLGASVDEILEAIEIGSAIGLDSATTAMPIRADELSKHRRETQP